MRDLIFLEFVLELKTDSLSGSKTKLEKNNNPFKIKTVPEEIKNR